MEQNWFNYFSGFASILGLIAAFYFHQKSKSTHEMAKSFYEAIKLQSDSIENELKQARGIKNPDYFQSLSSKVESITSHMSSLNQTITTFHKSMWSKDKI